MTTPPKKRGFSYIEVLGAMLLLSFGLLALVPLFALGMKVNGASRDLTTANTLAREKLEQLAAYPSTDLRLAIPTGATLADETNNTRCANDLPRWYKPSTGETSTQTTNPGTGWYRYSFTRTYTVTAFPLGLGAPVASTATDESVFAAAGGPTPYYAVKLITVTVAPLIPSSASPSGGVLPGLRTTRQSVYLRFRLASGA